jgi:hypothetical protein
VQSAQRAAPALAWHWRAATGGRAAVGPRSQAAPLLAPAAAGAGHQGCSGRQPAGEPATWRCAPAHQAGRSARTCGPRRFRSWWCPSSGSSPRPTAPSSWCWVRACAARQGVNVFWAGKEQLAPGTYCPSRAHTTLRSSPGPLNGPTGQLAAHPSTPTPSRRGPAQL